ncbi:bifunctional riboflavin kinase/FAD synthetase [Cetobacterium somerae]|uniref:bifunctional riboflavin kinase/FAD synthetase n=1 Tax=Cetobacterium somerae TaxID=188913 RepID=UPI003D7680F6
MKIIEDILLTKEKFENTYVAIGAFDGIHMGHRELISQAVEKAKKTGGKAVVFTFLNHPMEITNTVKAPKLISSLDEKIHIIKSLGVDYLILQPFTKDFSNMIPEEFVEKVLKKILNTKEVYVGFNFSFGKGGKGTVENLKKLGKKCEININIIEPIKIEEQIISSTFIRQMLATGKLDIANRCLGQPFLIIGEVVHGRKLGRVMGFPTANLKILNKIYPPFGIYGGKVRVEGENKCWNAVINIGKNPTLKPDERSIEVHILDFNRDIYGKRIYVSLIEFLREEKKFNSMDELKETITKDVLNWREKVKVIEDGYSIKDR